MGHSGGFHACYLFSRRVVQGKIRTCLNQVLPLVNRSFPAGEKYSWVYLLWVPELRTSMTTDSWFLSNSLPPSHPNSPPLFALLGGRPGGGGSHPGTRQASLSTSVAEGHPLTPPHTGGAPCGAGEVTPTEKPHSAPYRCQNSAPSRCITFAQLSFCHPGETFTALEENT